MALWIELFVVTVGMLVTVAFHAAGLAALSWSLDKVHPEAQDGRTKRALAAALLTIGLALITTIEIWVYALFYVAVGAIADLREAVYFSTVAFSTLGFSDAAIADQWKLVGAVEGINGALLIGWSVAFLVVELTRHIPIGRRRKVEHPNADG